MPHRVAVAREIQLRDAGSKFRSHVGPDAIDVDVQLAVGASARRINHEGDLAIGDIAAGEHRYAVPRVPGRSKIILRAGRLDARVLDAPTPISRYQQHLRRAADILEERIAVRGVG